MKSELKALYKRDKKLAVKVAKVLGYKICLSEKMWYGDEKTLKNITTAFYIIESWAKKAQELLKSRPGSSKGSILHARKIIIDAVDDLKNLK